MARQTTQGATPYERAAHRDVVGRLKSRLHDHRDDVVARTQLAELYRRSGHLEQAGRYAIGLDAAVDPAEQRAYVAMLRGLRADEEAARELSLLPSGRSFPEGLREALSQPYTNANEWREWGYLIVVAWVLVVALSLATLTVTYAFTISGATDARGVAQTWTAAVACGLTAASVLTAAWCIASHKALPATVWSGLAMLAGAGAVVAVVTAAL